MNSKYQKKFDLASIKKSFESKENILNTLSQTAETRVNEQVAIQISYDLQAGSYSEALNDPVYAGLKAEFCTEIAQILDDLNPSSVLEAGVGEATTLAEIALRTKGGESIAFAGFDLSWSRCHYARHHIATKVGRNIPIFLGALETIPMPSDSVDLVYTAHAIEPNHGREGEILRELYRVAQRYVALFEPAYELANSETRLRMEQHGYCRGLEAICKSEGWTVHTYRLMDYQDSVNPSQVLIIEKSQDRQTPDLNFGCPLCHRPLVLHRGEYFCEAEGVVYPTIRGIPCLLGNHAVIANKLMVDFPESAK